TAAHGLVRDDVVRPEQAAPAHGPVPHRPARGPARRSAPLPQPGPAPPAVAGAAHPRRPQRAHRVGRRLPPAHLPHPGSRVTDMPELHTRLLADVIALGSPYTPWSSPADMPCGHTASSTAPARTSTSPPSTRRPWPTSPPRSAPAWKTADGRCTRWRRPHCPPASP